MILKKILELKKTKLVKCIYLLNSSKKRHHLQEHLAVPEEPRLGKAHPHAPWRGWVTPRSLHCSPLSGAHCPWGREKQAPFHGGCGGRRGERRGYRDPGEDLLCSGRRGASVTPGGPAEQEKGAAMLRPVPAPLGIRSNPRPVGWSEKALPPRPTPAH